MLSEDLDPLDLSSFDRVLDDCNAFIVKLSQGTFSGLFISESTLNRMPESLREGAMRFRTWRLQRFRLQNREATVSLLNALVELEKVLRAELRQVVTHKATLRDLCGNTYIALTELIALRTRQIEQLDSRTDSVRSVVNSATEGLSSLKCMMTFLAETFRLRDIENSNKPGQAKANNSKKKNNANNAQLYLTAIKEDDVGAELYQRQLRMKKLRDRSMKYLECLLEKREAVSVERDHCSIIIEALVLVGSMDKEKMAAKYAHSDHSEFMKLTSLDGHGLVDLLSIRTLSKVSDDTNSHGKNKISLEKLESTLSGKPGSYRSQSSLSSDSPKPAYDTLSASDIVNYERVIEKTTNSSSSPSDFHDAVANLQSSVRPAGIRHRLSSLFIAPHSADDMIIDERRLAVTSATPSNPISLLSRSKHKPVFCEGTVRVDGMFKEFSEVYQLLESTDQSKLFTAQLSLRLEEMVQARERLREQAELIKTDVEMDGHPQAADANETSTEESGDRAVRRPSVFGFIRKMITFSDSSSSPPPSSSTSPPPSNSPPTTMTALPDIEASSNMSIAERDALACSPSSLSPNAAMDDDDDGTVRVVSMQASRIMDALKGEVERVRTSSKRISLMDDPALKDLLFAIQSTPNPYAQTSENSERLGDVGEVCEEDEDANNVFASHNDEEEEEDLGREDYVLAETLTTERMASLNERPPSPPAQSRASV